MVTMSLVGLSRTRRVSYAEETMDIRHNPSPPSPSLAPEEPPMSLRIDLSAHNAARIAAHDAGCSVSAVLIRALRLGLKADSTQDG